MRMFFAGEQRVYSDEMRFQTIQRRLMSSESYLEFQNFILFCTGLAVSRAGGGKKGWGLPLAEIKRLSQIDMSSRIAVSKVYNKYINEPTTIYEVKRDAVSMIKNGARKDMLTIQLLEKYGINDIEKWWWENWEKHKMPRRDWAEVML